MDYFNSNDAGKKQADGQTAPEGTGVSHDGKAYKLIKLNYNIVIIVRTTPKLLLPPPVLIKYIHQVDDSTSMQLGHPISRWQECSEAISVIAEAALEFDSEGIDIHFLNSPNFRTCKVIIFTRKLGK